MHMAQQAARMVLAQVARSLACFARAGAAQIIQSAKNPYQEVHLEILPLQIHTAAREFPLDLDAR
jgi:hypothetical protein